MKNDLMEIGYLNDICRLAALSDDEKQSLSAVSKIYRFRANSYYLSLIDWDEPDDPIRTLIIPQVHELEKWGHFDPSGEQNFTVLPGVEHKYPSTVLLLVSNVCGGICRYCFRKRVFISSHGEIVNDLSAAIAYIRAHPEITNVLLTGGDPLVLSTNRLRRIINEIKTIDHIKIVRIGSKMPAFNPYRIIDDPELIELFASVADAGKQLYIMTHFNHAREITDVAVQSVRLMHNAGAVLANQTPLIRGVNDNPEILAELFNRLSFIGVPPYYVFQCRPASGNKGYAVPIEEGYHIFEKAKAMVSGLAKRARFTMSHVSGKIEVVGVYEGYVYFKYHRAADTIESSRFMVFQSNPGAYWFDDYKGPVERPAGEFTYQSYGPE